MKVSEIRKYWVYKYSETFDESYKTRNYAQEFILLKRLLDKYGEWVILEAIDELFRNHLSRDFATINFFASKKVFSRKFEHIIKLSDIIKYRRFLLTYPQFLQEKVKRLIQEYGDYSVWEIISDKEKVRKVEIVKELEELTVDKSKGY